MSPSNLLPDWTAVRDNLWAALLVAAVTVAFSWVATRYKRAPLRWQWTAFCLTEVLLCLAGQAAVFRYGAVAFIPAVVGVAIPFALLYRFDRDRQPAAEAILVLDDPLPKAMPAQPSTPASRDSVELLRQIFHEMAQACQMVKYARDGVRPHDLPPGLLDSARLVEMLFRDYILLAFDGEWASVRARLEREDLGQPEVAQLVDDMNVLLSKHVLLADCVHAAARAFSRDIFREQNHRDWQRANTNLAEALRRLTGRRDVGKLSVMAQPIASLTRSADPPPPTASEQSPPP